MNKLLTILKHRWLDSSDTRRLIPDDMAERLANRIGAHELRRRGINPWTGRARIGP